MRALYEGMFRRIAAAYPVDDYWLWTPEAWTWYGNNPGQQFEATRRDVLAAHEALQSVGRPFDLVIAGWTLGPQQDPAAFDRFLPGDIPVGSLNRVHGHAPVDAMAGLQGRSRWRSPGWKTMPHGRLSALGWVACATTPWTPAASAATACWASTGARALAMNVAALAAAAWDQSWVPATFDNRPVTLPCLWSSVPGSSVATPLLGAADGGFRREFFLAARYDGSGITLPIASGIYSVTLEPGGPP